MSSSYKTYAEGFLLSAAAMKWYTVKYLGQNPQAAYPPFPIYVENLHNLPKTYLVAAECDVLYDEGVDYANKLRAANNVVHEECMPGVVHGFLN